MNISRLTAVITTCALAFSISTADASKGPQSSRANIKKIVVEEALATNVPPSLALAVAKVESDFQAHVESSKGARGVMQIMPATGTGEWGVSPDELWDPRLNVRLGIDYLGQLIERYDGNWEFALSFYNGGSKVGKPGQARVLPWTRKYVNNVLRWEQRYAAQRKIWMALVDREDDVNGSRSRKGKTWKQVADNRDWPRKSATLQESDTDTNVSADERSGNMAIEVAKWHGDDEDKRWGKTIRPRVKWTNTPKSKRQLARQRRLDRRIERRQNRKNRRNARSNGDFDNIEKRLKAVRGSLDDFS
jgi:hypothetical protein